MARASAYFTVDDISGKHDIKELKRELDTLPGVLSVSVNDETERITVDYDATGVERDRLQKKIETLGYHIADVQVENQIL